MDYVAELYLTGDRPLGYKTYMNTAMKLIEAYLNIVLELGSGGISVRNLTNRVGITKSSFYSHFDSIEDIENETIAFCLEEINKANFEINYKAKDSEDLFVQLINSFIVAFSQFPVSAFLVLVESQKLTNDKFEQLSNRINLMISARLTVALDFCVQRSWTAIDDTDSLAKLLTPYIKDVLLMSSDDDLENCVKAIIKLLK